MPDDKPDAPDAPESVASEGGHWNDLAEMLGAEVSEVDTRPAEPAAESTSDESPKPTPKPIVKKEKEKAPQSRSHWQTLAGLLGIKSNKAFDEEEVLEEPEQSADVAAPVDPGFSSDDKQVKQADKSPATVKTRPAESPSAVQEQDRDESSSGFGLGIFGQSATSAAASDDSASEISEKFGASFEPDETDIRQAESKSVLDSMFTPSDESYWAQVDDDDDSASEESDDLTDPEIEAAEEMAADDSTVEDSPRSGGRSRRRQRRSSRTRSDSQSTSDDSERGEQPKEARNERGRRRRGRGSDTRRERPQRESKVDEADVLEDPVVDPSDSVLRLEASADLFDDPPEIANEETPRKSRDPNSAPEERKKSRIPSWDEAVGVIVKRNLDSRGGDNDGGGGGGGNNRRRRGNRKRRPRSNS